MAEIVRIVLQDSGGNENTSLAKSTPSSSSQNVSGGIESARAAVKAARTVVAATGAKRIADSFISYRVSTISLRTGAVEYQQRAQFVYSEVSGAVSSLGAIAMGALMGGPVGAGVAALGVGINYLMKFIGWEQNANTLRLEKNAEDVSIRMQTIRAGLPRRWQDDD